MAEENTIKRF